MARSFNYKMFGAKSIDDLSAEQYNILILAESERIEIETQEYERLKQEKGGKRHLRKVRIVNKQ